MAAPALAAFPSSSFCTLPPPPAPSPSPATASHFLSRSIALKSLFAFLSSDSSHLQIASGEPPPSSLGFSRTSKKDEDYIVGPFCPRYPSSDILCFSRQKKQWSFRGNRVFATMRASTRSHRMQAFPGTAASRSTGIRSVGNNYNGAPLLMDEQARFGEVTRTTKETDVKVCINLDGTGMSDCNTGIPFLDHMLDQLASHGLFDLTVQAKGDLHIDDHHTNEDVALALGTALFQALGDRKGIYRFGDFSAPLDEAVIHVVLDLSGRPYLGHNLCIPSDRVGTYDTQLVEHFFQSLVNTSGMTLHIFQLCGKNSHHIIEATFKAFARALREAVKYDERRKGRIPSSKGVLSGV